MQTLIRNKVFYLDYPTESDYFWVNSESEAIYAI